MRKTPIAGSLAVCALAIALVAQRAALAFPPHGGGIVGNCVTVNDITYNVVASVASPWSVSMLSFVFDPIPANLISYPDPPVGTVLYFQVSPPGHYTVTEVWGLNPFQGTYAITAPDCAPPRHGMTWRLLATNSPTGTILVGCAEECDAYHGDTECTAALPLLCIRKAGTGFPPPASVDDTDPYSLWSGGVIGTTSATVPPATLAGANDLCVQEFGKDWRVAEFHDGSGWNFQAYGGVGIPSSRFWVDINDQPDATCWH